MEKIRRDLMCRAPPFLTRSEFEWACEDFICRCNAIRWAGTTTKLVDRVYPAKLGKDGTRYLELQRLIVKGQHHDSDGTDRFIHVESPEFEGEIELFEGEDEAVIYRSPSNELGSTVVAFSIVHSPIYRVPVLYFQVMGLDGCPIHNIDAVHKLLVPQDKSARVRKSGVTGAITMVNHPVTDIVCYMIHPCNTADAMQELIGTRQTSLIEYLQIWFGLVGGAVGLYLPKELAIASQT